MLTALPVTVGPGRLGGPLLPLPGDVHVGSVQWLSPAPPHHTALLGPTNGH